MENLGLISMLSNSVNFWRGKKVLVTGHTGFKGAWLVMWLRLLGADVSGLSLPPAGPKNLFSLARLDQVCNSYFCDVRDIDELNN